MSVAACPRCHDRVTVPGGAPPEATVQCPLCGEEFELLEVLGALPPALVVVKVPRNVAATAPASGAFDFQPSAGESDHDEQDEFRLADDDQEHSAAGAFAFESSPADSDTEAATPRSAVKSPPRRKKKQVNPVAEVVKVAFGGLAGVIIAIVLVWYLPWGYAQDFLGIGPSIAEIPVVGGIVPERFRGEGGSTNESNDTSRNMPDVEPEFRGPARNNNGRPNRSIADFAPDDSSAADQPSGRRNQPAESTPANEPSSDAVAEGGSDAKSGADSTGEELPLVDFTNIDSSDDPPLADAPPGPRAPGGQPLGPKSPPAVNAADLQPLAAAVSQSAEEYTASEGESGAQRVKVARAHYQDYARLAETVTFVDQSDPAIGSEVRSLDQLLSELIGQTEKIGIMQFFAAKHMDDAQRPTDGAMIVGAVTEVRAEGRLYLSRLRMTPPKMEPREVTVLSPLNPMQENPNFRVGSTVAMLGSLVDNPAENLAGYQGQEPQAMWGGYFVVLAAGQQ